MTDPERNSESEYTKVHIFELQQIYEDISDVKLKPENKNSGLNLI